MSKIGLAFWGWFMKRNGWRIVAIVATAYFAIASYTHGWFNSFIVVCLFWSLYNLGYHAALTDAINRMGFLEKDNKK